MIFRPFYRFETGCAAYVFGCGGQGLACVVDPQEAAVDAYIGFAESKGMRITRVFDTHVHADHRSGGRALAARTGARYGMFRSADVTFAFDPLDDGQVIELGNTVIRVVHVRHARRSTHERNAPAAPNAPLTCSRRIRVGRFQEAAGRSLRRRVARLIHLIGPAAVPR